MNNCIQLFKTCNFQLLSEQVFLFLPLISSNVQAFQKGFKKLELDQLNTFFSTLIFELKTSKTPLSKELQTELVCLLNILFEVFKLKFDSPFESNFVVKKAVIENLIVFLVNEKITKKVLSLNEGQHLLSYFFSKKPQLVVWSFLETCKKLKSAKDFQTFEGKNLTLLAINLHKPTIKWFVVEVALFWLKKNFFLFLQKTSSLETNYEALELVLVKDLNTAFNFQLNAFFKNFAANKLKFCLALVLLYLLYEQPALAAANNSSFVKSLAFLNSYPLISSFFLKKKKQVLKVQSKNQSERVDKKTK